MLCFSFFMTLTGYWTHTKGFRLSKSQQPKYSWACKRNLSVYLLFYFLFTRCVSLHTSSFLFTSLMFVVLAFKSKPSTYKYFCLQAHRMEQKWFLEFSSPEILFSDISWHPLTSTGFQWHREY